MDASSRAKYLRIKRSSESLPDLTEAEKAELAKLEAAGHVKPKRALTFRRPDPAPISGEIQPLSTMPTAAAFHVDDARKLAEWCRDLFGKADYASPLDDDIIDTAQRVLLGLSAAGIPAEKLTNVEHRMSGFARPSHATPRPSPIADLVAKTSGCLPVDELNYTWTLTFVVTAAPEIVAEGFDPLHCSSSEHMLRRIAVWQGNGAISVELCEASAPPADEILREQGYAGRELELELDRITTPWANWASASDIAAAHGLDVEDVEDALDETGVATSRAHSRAGRGWTLDPKAATVFSPAAIELVLGEIRRR